MTEQVIEVCRSRSWAEVQLERYATTIKAMDVWDYMGLKLKESYGMWHIILVDRREQ